MKARMKLAGSYAITEDVDADEEFQGERTILKASRGGDKFGFYYKPINFELRQGSKMYQPGCVLACAVTNLSRQAGLEIFRSTPALSKSFGRLRLRPLASPKFRRAGTTPARFAEAPPGWDYARSLHAAHKESAT